MLLAAEHLGLAAHTTIDSLTPSNTGSSFASAVVGRKISNSLRGVAWQNSTSPRPGIDRLTVIGHIPGLGPVLVSLGQLSRNQGKEGLAKDLSDLSRSPQHDLRTIAG